MHNPMCKMGISQVPGSVFNTQRLGQGYTKIRENRPTLATMSEIKSNQRVKINFRNEKKHNYFLQLFKKLDCCISTPCLGLRNKGGCPFLFFFRLLLHNGWAALQSRSSVSEHKQMPKKSDACGGTRHLRYYYGGP